LLDRVKRLLDADARSERVFTGALPVRANCKMTSPATSRPGGGRKPGAELSDEERRHARIARYKCFSGLAKALRRGLHGRTEEPVRRRVAVKVIKLGMDTKNVIARFEAERQALAMMEHPKSPKFWTQCNGNWPPLFRHGTGARVRITEFCDQRNLDIRQRLDLFIQIAMPFSTRIKRHYPPRHQPSNILVTLHDGVPVPR